MFCRNCGSNVNEEDICVDKCVYCFGTIEPYKESFMTCFLCGKEHKILTNDLCSECFIKWNSFSNEEREEIIKNTWKKGTK